MDQMKVVMIGAGKRATEGYIPTIQTMSDRFHLAAIHDIDPDRVDAAGAEFDIPSYSNLEEMFSNITADFAIIAVPALEIHQATMDTAEFDLHLLVETPISIDLASADQIARIAKIHNVKLEIAETSYRRPHERIKQLMIQENVFGKINLAYCRFVGQGYHAASILRSYIGFDIPPVHVWGHQQDFQVQSHTQSPNAVNKTDTECWQHGVIKFRDGRRAVYDFTTLSYGSPLRWHRSKATTEIYGEKGMCVGLEPIVLSREGETHPIVIRRQETDIAGVNVLEAYVVEAEPEVVWENPFREYPLTDSQVALACCLTNLENAIRNDTDLEYGFLNARTDREIDIAIGASAENNGIGIEIL